MGESTSVDSLFVYPRKERNTSDGKDKKITSFSGVADGSVYVLHGILHVDDHRALGTNGELFDAELSRYSSDGLC